MSAPTSGRQRTYEDDKRRPKSHLKVWRVTFRINGKPFLASRAKAAGQIDVRPADGTGNTYTVEEAQFWRYHSVHPDDAAPNKQEALF